MHRRNLLERYVSEQRARSTGVWWVTSEGWIDSNAKPTNDKAISLDIQKYLEDIILKEHLSRKYDGLLEGHDVLNVYYENLSENPEAVGKRAIRFLGLDPHLNIPISFRKADVRPMSAVVENYDEINAKLRHWSSF